MPIPFQNSDPCCWGLLALAAILPVYLPEPSNLVGFCSLPHLCFTPPPNTPLASCWSP